jgi:hypothetical protein
MLGVSRQHRSTAIQRAVMLGACSAAIGFAQSAGALGAEAPNPFFPSSSSTPKHTTIKAVAGKNKAASLPTRRSSAPKFPVPASAKVKATTVPALKSSGTISSPSSPASAIAPTGSSTSAAGTPLNSLSTTSKRPVTASRHDHRSTLSSLSGEAIVVAALAGLLIVLCLLWSLAHWLVYEPRWMLSSRHSLEEARFRVSSSLSEFADWVRLGR